MKSSRGIKVAALASTLAVGGAERQLAALARGLRKRGYEFSFFLWRDAGAVGRELRGDGFGVAEKIAARPARWLGLVAELRAYNLLLALDHNNVLTLLPAFSRRLPAYVVLYHLQGGPPGRWRNALRRARAVVAVAASQLEPLRKAGIISARLVVNGVAVPAPVGPADRRRAREDLGVAADATVAAVVSRLSREKGVDVLLTAAALLERGDRPWLLIAGDGPERGRLEALARGEYAGRYTFLGELDDVSPVYRAADFFVLPSRRESAPLALLEAMAHGLAAAAAAAGDVPAILAGGVGLTFTPGSPVELARAMKTLTAEPAKRAAMGALARAAVAGRYDVDRMLDEYDALFNKVSEGALDGTGDG